MSVEKEILITFGRIIPYLRNKVCSKNDHLRKENFLGALDHEIVGSLCEVW